MFTALKSKSDEKIISSMENTMHLKSGNSGKFNFREALIVVH